jgi:lipopolysaccharide export system protein LptA
VRAMLSPRNGAPGPLNGSPATLAPATGIQGTQQQ